MKYLININDDNFSDWDEKLYDKVFNFLDFVSKINFSNSQIVVPSTHSQFQPYRYRVKKGNNSVVLVNCFKSR